MTRKRIALRTPVRRQHAQRYLLITLLVFAASVAVTRFFLELTGYPKLGGGSLHIAHVLWGGLLLFIAVLLPLIFANRWMYDASAALAGGGVGLFIDEVGKFITQNNDYFIPAAAPIIYAFFLLTILLYLQIRRQPSRDPRSEFYAILDGFGEVLDRDLEPEEREQLLRRLQSVAHCPDRNLARLASVLITFLESQELQLAPSSKDFLERAEERLAAFEARWISPVRWRVALAGGLAALGAFQLGGMLEVLLSIQSRTQLQGMLANWILRSHVESELSLFWFLMHVGLETATGLLLIAGGILLLARKDRVAVSIGTLGLLLSLTVINLMVFYFNQFSTILPAALEFFLLVALLRFRRLHVPTAKRTKPELVSTSAEPPVLL